jgi:hypothetical protein
MGVVALDAIVIFFGFIDVSPYPPPLNKKIQFNGI